jgi:hypothetical protein
MTITARQVDDQVIEEYALALIWTATQDYAADDMDEDGTFSSDGPSFPVQEPDTGAWIEETEVVTDEDGHEAACKLAEDLAETIRSNPQEFLAWARQAHEHGPMVAPTSEYRELSRQRREAILADVRCDHIGVCNHPD